MNVTKIMKRLLYIDRILSISSYSEELLDLSTRVCIKPVLHFKGIKLKIYQIFPTSGFLSQPL